MGKSKGHRRSAQAALLALATALLTLALTAPAMAGGPFHTPAKALDVTGLNKACGTAVDNKGDLYASSAGEGKVKVLNPAHTELTSIANANTPCALAVTTTGALYVSEQGTGNVVRYKPNAYPFAGTPTYGSAEAIDSSGKAKGIAVDPVNNRLYVAEGDHVSVYDATGKLATIDEVQSVTVNGASGGTFKLEFKGQKTAPIPFNASAPELDTALEALSTVGAGNVEVKLNVLVYEATFTGALGGSDLSMLIADPAGLTGPPTPKVTVAEISKGFNGQVKGGLGDATGASAFTYTDTALGLNRLYLAVADAATDELKLFSGSEPVTLKLRKTISGVDQDAKPSTPNQSFGFGTKGAYLGADPGNEITATKKCTQVSSQACTAGHFFLFDAEHGVIDEFDATGEFLDQLSGGLADAEPTQVAVDRSGGANDGTIYVSSGSSTGAKLVAFGPLSAPSRAPLPALSRVLAGALAVATDFNGNVYVANQFEVEPEVKSTKIHLYSPTGTEITSFEDAENVSGARDLAVDSKGNVYTVDGTTEQLLAYYHPSSYPPTGSTTYTRNEVIPSAGVPSGSGLVGVAVNPANDHAFVVGTTAFEPVIAELGSASEGSPLLDECGSGLLIGGRIDIDVYGKSGEVYVTSSSKRQWVLKCGAEKEVIREFRGGGCPNGEVGATPRIAVDQSNGHLLEFSILQTGEKAREYDAAGACVAEYGTFSIGGQAYRVAIDNSCALHSPPLTEQTTPTCKSFDPANGNTYVAFDSSNNGEQPYDVSAFGPLDYGTAPAVTKFKLKVTKTGSGTGKVTSSPAGIDCGSTCEAEFEEGTEVTLSASPEGGSSFAGWSGAGCSGTGTCKVTMSEAKTVTAEFTASAKPKFLLKVKAAGSGTGTVTSSPSGINCGLDCNEEYDEGTAVTLTGAPGANTKAVLWTGCDSVNGENKCLVAMSAAKEVTATFNLEAHLLSVSKTGSGTGKVTSSPAGIDCGSTCSASFDHGTLVTLSASPEGGSSFAGWSGAGCSGTGTCVVTMSAAKEVSAEFTAAAKPKFLLKVKPAGSGTGTVTSAPSGINCGIDCEEEYDEGTPVTLTGAAGANSKAVVWTGCDSVNGENKCLVAMSGAKEVTATFDLEQHLLSVSKTGSGAGKVTSSPPGIDCDPTCSANFDHGTVVTLEADPDPGSEFSGWSGSGCSGTATCEVTMSTAKSVTADFDEEAPPGGIALTVAVEGTGTGTVASDKGAINCNPFCSDEYAEGTVVVLTATPNPGSVFISWKYCDSGGVNGRKCTVTVDKAKTVKATFTTTHALEVSREGTGLGKVQSSPGGILCLSNCQSTTAAFKEGTALTLKQTPAKHFHFVKWLGDCTGSAACELTMGQDHEVGAEFAQDAKHPLTLTKSGGGQGTVKSNLAGISCGATCSTMSSAYYQGEVIELTYTLGKGSTFGGWSGCDSQPEGKCLVAMSGAKGVTAEFK